VVDCCYNGLGILDRIDEFMTYYDDRIVRREKWLMTDKRARPVNIRYEEYDVYIGRPRSGEEWGFGNPFIVGIDGARGECAEKFKNWIITGNNHGCVLATEERRQWIINNVASLHGKRLGCFCAPRACHGDYLSEWAAAIHYMHGVRNDS